MQHTLERLHNLILDRRDNASPQESYVAKLFYKGRKKICQKVGEEAVELVIDAMAKDRKGSIKESADLLFHLNILWAELGITPADIAAELQSREGMSGLSEKANRKMT